MPIMPQLRALLIRACYCAMFSLLVIVNSSCAKNYRTYELSNLKPIADGPRLALIVVDNEFSLTQPLLAHNMVVKNLRSDAYLISIDLTGNSSARRLTKQDVLSWIARDVVAKQEFGLFLPSATIFDARRLGAKLCNIGLRSWNYSGSGAALLCGDRILVFTNGIESPTYSIDVREKLNLNEESPSSTARQMADIFSFQLTESGDKIFFFRKPHSSWNNVAPELASNIAYELVLTTEQVKKHRTKLGTREFIESIHEKNGKLVVLATVLDDQTDGKKSQFILGELHGSFDDYIYEREYSNFSEAVYSVRLTMPYDEAELVIESKNGNGKYDLIFRQKIKDLLSKNDGSQPIN